MTGDVVGDGAPEGGDRVLRRALAEHADDRAVGLGELDADRGGEAEAEAAAGAEVVAAGPREPQLVAQRERAGGRLEDDDRRPRGRPRPGRECTVEELSGSARPGSPAGPRFGSGAGAADSGTASSSASRVSPTSATIASPIGARAASSGSLVIATSSAPSGSSGPGMYG